VAIGAIAVELRRHRYAVVIRCADRPGQIIGVAEAAHAPHFATSPSPTDAFACR
jgi:hypothetical protein